MLDLSLQRGPNGETRQNKRVVAKRLLVMRYMPAGNNFEVLNAHTLLSEMPGIPNCGNLHKRYPGLFFDRDNLILQENINLTTEDDMKKLFAIFISKFFPGIRGKRSHIHAVLAIALYTVAAVMCYKAGNILGVIVLAGLVSHVCAQGASRWTLKAIEKKVDLLLVKNALELKRD